MSAMNQAVNVSDGLGYMEPPRDHQPARQCLGWVLLEAGRPKEAEDVYQQDLWQFPNNPWSLYGLFQSLQAQGRTRKKDADTALKRYQDAWMGEQDEMVLTSSCPMFSSSAPHS